MNLIPFLWPQKACEYQLLNRFFYDIAIGRVQTRLTLGEDHLFTYWHEDNLSKMVIGYDKVGGVKCYATDIDMSYWLSCQINCTMML